MSYNINDEKKIDKAVLKTDDANNIEQTLYQVDGVDDGLIKQGMSAFQPSNDVANDNKEVANAQNSYKDAISQPMISDSTMNKMNSSFTVPSAVTEADAWLSNQLQKIQSGKTSYSDDVRNMMDKITNREKFSYDVDTDPLFQQALASAMSSGKQAMQDTIGQASALTGGYGSTYATSAGNQAYNSFIEDAYDNLDEYYQLAMQAYQMEGDEMYRQLGMYTDADDREYNRNVAAYDATFNYRNQMYNESYGQYRDEKSDAFAMGNLELGMYGQKVQDAYNYYNIASNEADKQYQREYNSWQDSINQAWQMINAQSSDYQNQTNREFQATESQKQRDWQTSEGEKDRNFQATENEKQRSFTASENAKDRSVKSSSGGSGKAPTSDMKSTALNLYNSGNQEKLVETLDYWISEGYDVSSIEEYVNVNGSEFGSEAWASDYSYLNSFEIYNDDNKFLKDTYKGKNSNGEDVYLTYNELSALIYGEKNKEDGIPYAQRKNLIDKYKAQSKK